MSARWAGRIGMLAVGAAFLVGATAARAEQTKEIRGKVLKADSATLYVEHMGAVIPLEIGRSTRFAGVASAHDLTEGQEVRASFTVRGDTNVAHGISIGRASTMGAREPASSGYNAEQDYGG